ncbi:cytochrome c maturation protein CcmE [Brevundimonas variabilis]|uniref:Cytochrome c-type biogenesis protein CcmE n=1 Tax=Brevundimonas variabilis TaxID=74312 RepID=A0A7W9CFS4_9CAUL|nr:cytochrome c maturation protein CcmE [Brevundimonas variabilis]MBB5744631.1 cytochrome c-type biogenesis protein CcmE [Brevundimonas variabilis]
MSWLPKSPKARRRLWIVAAVAPVLALAVGLSLWAMTDNVTYFFSPSEVTPQNAPAGREIRLGGLVEAGSVEQQGGGEVVFAVTDNAATTRIVFQGDLPDLFREGQGIVAQGSFEEDRTFRARQVLAKHDETYMPREVADRLKAKGEWRPEGEAGAYTPPATGGTMTETRSSVSPAASAPSRL